MPIPFTQYTGGSLSALAGALLAPNSGIDLVAGSIQLDASGPGAVNYYDGSLTPLGIGAGLLLTSGTTPGTSNTATWFGSDNSGSSGFNNGSAQIDAVVNTVFNTVSYDATTLAFEFVAQDPTATSVSFDLVFGSDEYPEWVDQYVDCATVTVNGVNYALFNHDPMHPLSVVSGNLAAGYFINNAGGALPIEYDGVSHVLKIVAPIHAGTNRIEIGIADTGDHIYDSGIFIANLTAGNIPGSGMLVDPPAGGTDNSDILSGTNKSEYFDCKGGDDTVYAGGGDDIVLAGAGNDVVYGGSGDDDMAGDGGDDSLDGGDGIDTAIYAGASSEYSLAFNSLTGVYLLQDGKAGAASEGGDSLVNVEYAKFSDGLFQLSMAGFVPVTTPGGGGGANNPGAVVITGVGAVGNVLSAQVNDLDGVPGQVDYQWQTQDGGVWNNVGGNSASYTVTAADAGLSIRVIASYTDSANHAEAAVSVDKAILDPNAGDLVVTLMQLQAPLGASTMNPLTTLVQEAIELGISPNLAANHVKAVLGLDAGINLLHYDAWAILQSNPFDPAALRVEMVAVQAAILTSLSDDDSGVNLTLAIVDAADNGQTLDLADANDLAAILGLDITGITDKNLYPQPLREIFDRNKTMSDAVADGDGVAAIEAEWQDLLSIQDNIASTSIADLGIHINQAPSGVASVELATGTVGADYQILEADLLAGFSDPEGDTLAVLDLSADQGSLVAVAPGVWQFQPAAGFGGGPVELSYTVSDGLGGVAAGSQMFVMAAANQAPSLVHPLSDALAACKTAFNFTLPADAFADADAGDVLSYAATLADGAALPAWLHFDANSATFSGTPALAAIGVLGIMVTATDAAGASASDTFNLEVVSLVDGGAGNDLLKGTSVNDILNGHDGNDTLYGYVGDDQLNGGLGNDSLNGGLGADLMLGGLGDDKYWVDDAGDVIVENPGEGVDRVFAAIDYTLAEALEHLSLTGVANLSGTGNDLNNSLTGNAGANTLRGGLGNDSLNGGLGADLMLGGLGDDKYWVDDAGDVIVENPGEGVDRVFAAIDYTLAEALEHLSLTGVADLSGTGNDLNNSLSGNAGANTLRGGLGNDSLNGGLGADLMLGGFGDDKYWVDDAGDVVGENAGEGVDRVYAAIDYTLAEALEHLSLTGVANLSGTGNDLNNSLTGNAGANTLRGGLGNDSLNGGLGADLMLGGLGDDKYWVDDAGDSIVEYAGEGVDRVYAAIDYILAGALENLSLTGGVDLSGTGNELNNNLIGNTGANTLRGGLGNDSLNGGAGADWLDGGEGKDLAAYTMSSDGVRVDIGAGTAAGGDAEGDVLVDIENLSGSAWNDELIGNALANYLAGNAGNDLLMGGEGNDVLIGGLGNDLLVGGAGKDMFRFANLLDAGENLDSILDFNSADDAIQLESDVFAALGQPGKLSAANFRDGAAAGDADDYIVYDTASGTLSYDADGNGGGLAVQFAQFAAGTTVTLADFFVI